MSRAIFLAMQDDVTAERLLDLTRRHISLAKEAIQPNTLPERKKEIKAEIQMIRALRDEIISNYM